MPAPTPEELQLLEEAERKVFVLVERELSKYENQGLSEDQYKNILNSAFRKVKGTLHSDLRWRLELRINSHTNEIYTDKQSAAAGSAAASARIDSVDAVRAAVRAAIVNLCDFVRSANDDLSAELLSKESLTVLAEMSLVPSLTDLRKKEINQAEQLYNRIVEGVSAILYKTEQSPSLDREIVSLALEEMLMRVLHENILREVMAQARQNLINIFRRIANSSENKMLDEDTLTKSAAAAITSAITALNLPVGMDGRSVLTDIINNDFSDVVTQLHSQTFVENQPKITLREALKRRVIDRFFNKYPPLGFHLSPQGVYQTVAELQAEAASMSRLATLGEVLESDGLHATRAAEAAVAGVAAATTATRVDPSITVGKALRTGELSFPRSDIPFLGSLDAMRERFYRLLPPDTKLCEVAAAIAAATATARVGAAASTTLTKVEADAVAGLSLLAKGP